MSSITGNGRLSDFPLELIDEIISCNQDDFVFLRSASLVSKTWRTVTLRYLFSEASFLCKNDFVRWGLIGASLPHVALYVRNVVVVLGDLERLLKRANAVPTSFVGRAKVNRTYLEPHFPALDCMFPKDSEFDVNIPIMSNATSLHWKMHSSSVNATRFLTSFPNITCLSYSNNLLGPEIQEPLLDFFQKIRKWTILFWGGSRLVYVFSGHESHINTSQLEEIWIENGEPGAMDWLLDSVPRDSHTTLRIRKLGWEDVKAPFSSDRFACLMRMARGTLEELCFRPPWMPDDLEWCEALPFDFNVLPVLQILSIRILFLTSESDRIMYWLKSIFAVFPSCPCLQRLEFTFYLAESRDIDNVAFYILDWNSLVEDRYPSLKVLEFEMMMEDEEVFDVAERNCLETVIRQSMEMANSEKFVMRWSPAR